jgi:hypothetical protein
MSRFSLFSAIFFVLTSDVAAQVAPVLKSVALGRNQSGIAKIKSAPAKYPLRFVFTADTAFDRNTITRRESMFKGIAGLKDPPRFVMVAGTSPVPEPRHAIATTSLRRNAGCRCPV